MTTLSGKVALITGAARGQGRAEALALANAGADIIAIDICGPVRALAYPAATPEDMAETERMIQDTGCRVVAERVDVRDLENLKAAVNLGVDELGSLDIAVANAGISDWGRVWELTEDQWQDMIDVNLTGAWHTLKVSIPHMIDGGKGGSIVIVSSVAGLRSFPGQAHYAAAKHGLVGLTQSAALELGQFNIRVNSVHPYAVNTTIATDSRLGSVLAENPSFAPSFPASRLADVGIAEPEDIAQTVLYLASDTSRCVTGVQLPVDLGVNCI